MVTRIFIHGLDSSNQGTKSRFFRETYPDMIIPNFDGPLQERMEKLDRVLSNHSRIRMVGSSLGGLMATLFAMDHPLEVERIALLAPALHMLEFVPEKKDKTVSAPAWIFHGTADALIPPALVAPIARRIFLDLHFREVEDDHMLHRIFRDIPWDAILD